MVPVPPSPIGRLIPRHSAAEVREAARARGRTGMALLHGTELNIAPDGSVDWDVGFLSGFGICVASVHSETPITKHMQPAASVSAETVEVAEVIGESSR